MRVKGTHSRGQFLRRAAAFVVFGGLGCALIGQGGFTGAGRQVRKSKLEIRNSKFENRNPAQGAADVSIRPRIVQTFNTRPMTFEANRGQTDSRVKFLSRGSGYALFLTSDEAVLTLQKPSQMSNVKSQMSNGSSLGPSPQPPDPGVLRMRLVNANPSAPVVGVEELAAKSHYFIGNDPAQWHRNVPNYARVKYQGIYPGVDLVFYGNQRQLEYDFVLAPGADPGSIRLAIDNGNSKLEIRNSKLENRERIDAEGNLVIPAGGGEVVFHKPVVYQEQFTVDSSQLKVREENPNTAGNPKSKIQNPKSLEGRYVLSADGTVRFEVPGYDRSKALTIDPTLSYSTYLGGVGNDSAAGIAVDGAGSAYVVGQTLSANFPIYPSPTATPPPFQGSCRGCSLGKTSAFVTKFNPQGTALVYSTYLGGLGGDSAAAVAVDSAGSAYVVGTTLSSPFPTTQDAFQTSCNSCPNNQPSAFLTKFYPDGLGLAYSTYLGGSQANRATGVAVDSSGNAYVTGITSSDDFPIANAAQPVCGGSGGTGCHGSSSDAFVLKFDFTSGAPVYSTFLGGADIDEGHAIAIDSSGNAYVTGLTRSNNFPQVNSSRGLLGIQNAFVTEYNSTGALLYSTYLGGGGSDQGNGIAVDSSGEAFVTGITTSQNFPTQNPLIGGLRDNPAAFVSKLGNGLSFLIFSTYLEGNGTGNDGGNGIALDSAGNCYVTGFTSATDFPVVNGKSIQPNGYAGNQDAFVTKLNIFSTGGVFIFSTYLGGANQDTGNAIAIDSSGNAYVAGATTSNTFPTANAFQSQTGGGADAFVAELSGLALPAITANPTSLAFGNQPVGTTSAELTVTITNYGDAPLTFTAPVTTLAPFAVTSDTTCGTSSPLAPSASCTVGVTFAPTAAGSASGSLTFTDNLASSPQNLPLSGFGTAPSISFTASTLTFAPQGVGTTSQEQILTLTNTGNAPLIISSITISNNFAESNTCGSSVLAGSNCQIYVTFTPTTTGTLGGNLTFYDNLPGVPSQSILLSGTGVTAFGLSTPLPSMTVNRGTSQVQFTISAGSGFGFAGEIVLACLTTTVNCSFNPTFVDPSQPNPSTTLTVSGILNNPTSTSINFVVEGTFGTQKVDLQLQILISDFAMLVAPTVETVTAGQSATYILTVVPINNFTQTIKLTCPVGTTSVSCTVSPTSLAPDGKDNATATITLTTTASSLAVPRAGPKEMAPPLGPFPGPHWLLWLVALMMLSTLAARKSVGRRARLGFAMTVFFALLWAACNVSSTATGGTPTGNYGVVVIGSTTNGVIKHDAAFTLSVQ